MLSRETVKHFTLATAVALLLVTLILFNGLVLNPQTAEHKITTLTGNDLIYVKKLDTLTLPNADDFAQEVRANPEAVPNSLKLTSGAIRDLFLEISNEIQAQLFVKHLKPCAKENSSSPVSLKSVCMSYVHLAMLKYPGVYPVLNQ